MSDRLPILVLGGLFVVLLAAGVGAVLLISDEQDGRKHEQVTEASTPEPPATTTTPDPAEPLPSGPRKVTRRVRRIGTDGGVTFRLGAVTRGVRSMPLGRLGLGKREVKARPGREFVVVGLSFRALGGKADPLCGNGSELILATGRAQPIDGLYKVRGNDEVCGGGTATGSAQMVFSVPRGARPKRLAVWNPSQPDILGDSRLTFDLRR